ncbi:MAG: C1 family peptidase [Chitinophagaceae bacterium]|nr:C1 family peptidase [Chitinophagaceae bacterium]
MKNMSKHGLGWLPDLPDHRDKMYSAQKPGGIVLPAKTDLRKYCPPVYDQGRLGSCTANALGGAFEFEQMKQKKNSFTPSRLFIYYNERVIENSVASDSGAMLRDGIKTLAKQGVCDEAKWPYILSKFATKPSTTCYKLALQSQAVSYMRLTHQLSELQTCLADGYPFVIGFTVYESFTTDKVAISGHVPMPKPGEAVQGGHAVMAVGYDTKNKWFIMRNSWGEAWGMQGYFTMPFEYLTSDNLSDDFWTIRLVE